MQESNFSKPGANSVNSHRNLGQKAPMCSFSGSVTSMRLQVTLEIRAEREMQ
jgi:hypothetical protein